ncbi:transcriptional regulator [Siculibacillus lacustris]|uniref:Transcriptional regulator n=1 Tax=Siculibacillus lacustris TaxID=1549641 RepID=A0A4Q9VQE2_9HYPH|nr:transcriptional regulator [Siculibacillus lacustris]TBW38019.1 transcriptional regulator [Siculibacillus lacustris]
MPLTRAFRDTVKSRADRDPAFRVALLTEGLETLLAGDLETGKALLRDYVNATLGFEALASATGLPVKSLMRMLGPSGNPQARSLFTVIEALQRAEGLVLEVSVAADPEAA